MLTIAASLFTLISVVVLCLQALSLPANWALIALAGLWDLTYHPQGMDLSFYLWLLGLATLGEGIEFAGSLLGAAKYGASARGNLGAFAGAIGGALLGLPFAFGLGALAGAFVGAYAGCYFMEISARRDPVEARRAAMGALIGRVFGMVVKIAVGVFMLSMILKAVWSY